MFVNCASMADICSDEHSLDAKQDAEVTKEVQNSALLEVEETNKAAEIHGSIVNSCVMEEKEYAENSERERTGIYKGNILLRISKPKLSNTKEKREHYLKQFSPNRYILEKQIREKFKNMKINSRKKLKLDKKAKKEMCTCEAAESEEKETHIMKKENTEKEDETTLMNSVEKEKKKEEKGKEEEEEEEEEEMEQKKEEKEKKQEQEWEVKDEDMRQQKIEDVSDEKPMPQQEKNNNVKNDYSREVDEITKKIEYAEGCEQDRKKETASKHEMNIKVENEEESAKSNAEEIEKEKENIKEYEQICKQERVSKNGVGSKILLMKNHSDELHIYAKHEVETAEEGAFEADCKGEELERTRGISQIKEIRTNNRDFMKQKAIDSERLRYVFSILNMGIQKIETIKAMYRCYKENFNKSMREKMEKINSFIFYSNCNNFRSNFTVECLQNKYKLTNMKEERIGRLFLYIEDINKIKQALKIQQKENHKTDGIDNVSEKNESFYDANENIEDFFIFDDSISCCLGSEDIDSVLANSEYKTVSFLQDDDRFDDFFEEWMKDQSERRETDNVNIDKRGNNSDGKGGIHGGGEMEGENSVEGENNVKGENNDNNQYSAFNRFPKFSFKKYYCFDLNKNLCYIYSYTPSILKKLAEMLHSPSAVKNENGTNDGKTLDVSDKNNLNFDIDCQNEKVHYYHRYAVDGGHNLDTYIQFHCEKWQENLYDHVEVKSVDVEFNLDCLKCNIMQLF